MFSKENQFARKMKLTHTHMYEFRFHSFDQFVCQGKDRGKENEDNEHENNIEEREKKIKNFVLLF